MTRLKVINLFLLQWLFIRLTKHQETRIENFQFIDYNMMPDGSMSPRGMGTPTTYQWYTIQYWVLPTTGWKSDFKYHNGRPKFVKLTKDRKIEKSLFAENKSFNPKTGTSLKTFKLFPVFKTK